MSSYTRQLVAVITAAIAAAIAHFIFIINLQNQISQSGTQYMENPIIYYKISMVKLSSARIRAPVFSAICTIIAGEFCAIMLKNLCCNFARVNKHAG